MERIRVSDEVIREIHDEQGAIRATVLLSGKQVKEVAADLDMKADHLSKMLNESDDPRHFPPKKTLKLMDACGNEIYLRFLLMKRGYPSPREAAEFRAEIDRLAAENEKLKAEIEELRSEAKTLVNVFKNVDVR